MTLPDFLVIGTAKAGTTALYDYLGQHPQVFMNPEKETNFFAFEGQDIDFTGPGDEWNRTVVTDLERYKEQFSGAGTETVAVGESCPWYLYSERAAENIKRHVPDMKLIMMLRDPAERAFSSYLHVRRDGREKLSFEEGLREEQRRIKSGWEYIWHYKRVGMYHAQVRRYLETFPEEQVRIYLYEDFRSREEQVLAEIHEFIGVEEFSADRSLRPNATGISKSRFLEKLFLQKNPVRAKARYFMPKRLRHKLYHRINHKLVVRPSMESSTRRRLTESYLEDMEGLQRLTGLDLTPWRERDP